MTVFETILSAPVIALSVGLMAMIIIWHFSRSRSILEKWAQDNNFTILRSERRLLRRGPFFLTTGDNQEVYYVTVQDHHGGKKTGYVRCGSFWAGVFLDKAEVRWED